MIWLLPLLLIPRLDAPTERVLSQALVAEAETSRRDWAGIVHVLERRARRSRRTLLAQTKAYCAAWRARHARARRMRRLGPSDSRFRLARGFVRRWALGAVRDPCWRRTAWHWGSPSDVPRGRMVRVRCGPTANIFYGLR